MKQTEQETPAQTLQDEGTLPRPDELSVARFWRSQRDRFQGYAAVVASLIFWEVSANTGLVDPRFASSPTRIVQAFIDLYETGLLFSDISISGRIWLSGFGLALFIAVPAGFLMGWYRPFQAFFDPFVNFFNATPRIALLPLFLIWFGVGITSKIALVFMAALFPILINSIGGINSLDPTVLKAARSFGANDAQLFRTVALPGAIPYVLSGIRLGIAQGLTATVVAELYAATAGVGYMIAVSGNTFRTDSVFAGIIIVAGAGMLFTSVVARIERRFESWKPQTR